MHTFSLQINPQTGEEQLEEGPQKPLTPRNVGVFSFDSFDHRHTGRVTEDEFATLGRYYGFPVLSMRDAFWQLAVQQVGGGVCGEEREGERGVCGRGGCGRMGV